ncbi:MAG: hypothetical protein M1828_004157 [Chrysothrix sp. TS-e1954]|nr:MAG: hypothetical protein M1828_004157 [Chrysothrix sp. TS-e1954]
MDFLSRLIGGVGAVQGRKSSSTSNPQQRLARFKKTYGQALQVWHKSSASKPDPAYTESIRAYFQRLTAYLHDDTRAPSPHLCLSFAASSQIYIPIFQIALSVNNEDIIREAVAWFGALVDSDEENLLSNERFAEALLTFVDGVIGARGIAVGPQTEGEIQELIFGIAAKLRLETDLLPIWFVPDTRAGDAQLHDVSDSDADSPILTSSKTFPLCYQFIGHVYHEGRAGDFARTGLLYLFESASHSADLEEWIVSSDLPTLMASGLGALYSQLSRKLSIAHEHSNAPLILALSDSSEKQSPADVDSFYSETLQSQLTTFMSNLIFWQDILEHCRSREIRQTLIDHFQIFFLQQILYPSLLESSDIDGGSSVAVLTYIWRILDAVDHPDLIHLILNYLLALQEEPSLSRPTTGESSLADKKRQSLLSSQELNRADDGLTPKFFSLVDLILASIQSRNQETITAALRLISTIHGKHHGYAYSALIRTTTTTSTTQQRTLGALQSETTFLLSIARDIGGEEGMDDAYANCLKDAVGDIETHVCSLQHPSLLGVGPTADGKVRSNVFNGPAQAIQSHTLIPEDPILCALFGLLETFFTNDVETNLSLTDVFAHLVSCPYTNLERWLVPDPSKYEPRTSLETDDLDLDPDLSDPTSPEAESARIASFKALAHPPTSPSQPTSPFFRILHRLHQRSLSFRAEIDDFDHLLAGRKRAFQGAGELEAADLKPAAAPSSAISPASSRASSSSRAGSTAAATPQGTARRDRGRGHAPASASAQTITPASFIRGRAIKAIASLPRPTSSSPSSLKSAPGPPPRPHRQISPSPRGMSLSPSKATRTLSPLKFSINVGDGDGDGKAGEDRGGFDAASATSAESGEEIFERRIRFPRRRRRSGELEAGEVVRERGVGRASSSSEEGTTDERQNGGREEEGTGNDGHGHGDAETKQEVEEEEEVDQASVSHVLTNVVILHEFIMEIAALVQVRASLLEGEIRFV